MQQRKAIVIDIPMKKFMDRREDNRVIGRTGDPVIENQSREALAKTAESGLSAQPASPTALAAGGVCTRRRGNGAMCGRAADGGREECWLHAEWYSLLPAVFGMPYPEDAVAIHQTCRGRCRW